MEELTQGLEGMDPAELALGAGFVGILLTLVVIGHILWFFISAIGYRKMFLKAGERGWKAFIPYYSDFIKFKMSWNGKAFWLYLIGLILLYVLPSDENLILSLICLACAVVVVVMMAKMKIRLAKSFGKGKGWGWLLFFFPFIVSLILGYGKAEYIGNTTVNVEVEG